MPGARSDGAARRWVGVIAGQGELPRVLADQALKKGFGVVMVRLVAPPGPDVDGAVLLPRRPVGGRVRSLRVPISGWDGLARALQDAGVDEVYAAGKFHRTEWTARLEQAATAEVREFLEKGRYAGDEDLSRMVAEALERHGIRMGSQHELLDALLATRGVLSRREPGAREWRDIEVGVRLARGVAALDLGQTVVLKQGTVLAVEAAAEGTDAAIRRAGRIGGPGVVVVKVSRESQDLRFDTPVVGPRTIRAMRAARASCLAVEAGRCVVLHRDAMVAAADEAGIAVAGV